MSMKELGKVIQKRRKFLRITQEDLAEISGISERTLRSIESGEGNPELETLTQICEVLGLSIQIEVIK